MLSSIAEMPMKRHFFVPLLGCLVPFANVLAVANGGCSCDHLDVCTQVNDIPLVFAARDMVRKKFLGLGAKLLEKDPYVDEFAPPDNVPYNHITAFYADGRHLAQLRFIYAKEDFDSIVKDYASFSVVADDVTESKTGKYWSMRDGAEIDVKQTENTTLVSFVATAIADRLHAQLQPNYRSPLEDNPALVPAPDANAPPLSIVTSNPHQGLLQFHSEDTGMLRGKGDLREEMCGVGEDFDWTTIEHEANLEPDDGESLYVDWHSDGRASIKLGLKDEFGADIYRFPVVPPGKPTLASTDGDCRRRKVSVTYTATHSPQCLTVNAINQPSYAVAQKLIEVAGVHVDGMQLLPREKALVTFRDLQLSTKSLLRLLGDVTDLELVEKGPTRFEFRKPKSAH